MGANFVSIFVVFYVFFTFGAKWDFKNEMELRKWDFKMGLQTWCQKKRQWARNTLVFVSSRYANAFLRYCILNVFFLHAPRWVGSRWSSAPLAAGAFIPMPHCRGWRAACRSRLLSSGCDHRPCSGLVIRKVYWDRVERSLVEFSSITTRFYTICIPQVIRPYAGQMKSTEVKWSQWPLSTFFEFYCLLR